jgi:hypothetical protein
MFYVSMYIVSSLLTCNWLLAVSSTFISELNELNCYSYCYVQTFVKHCPEFLAERVTALIDKEDC